MDVGQMVFLTNTVDEIDHGQAKPNILIEEENIRIERRENSFGSHGMTNERGHFF